MLTSESWTWSSKEKREWLINNNETWLRVTRYRYRATFAHDPSHPSPHHRQPASSWSIIIIIIYDYFSTSSFILYSSLIIMIDDYWILLNIYIFNYVLFTSIYGKKLWIMNFGIFHLIRFPVDDASSPSMSFSDILIMIFNPWCYPWCYHVRSYWFC